MRKYKNIASQLIGILVFVNIIFGGTLILGIIYNDGDVLGLIVMCIVLVISTVMFDLMYIIMQNQFYITYLDENQITQKFFRKRKQISFNQVKYIYFVDQLLILSDNKIDIEISKKVTIRLKKNIKNELKNQINIWINISDLYLPSLLEIHCSLAERIFVGKIDKYIISKFDK